MFENLKIGEIARTVVRQVLEAGISDAELNNLRNPDYCKQYLGLNVPMLIPYEGRNVYRYYANPLVINGQQFLLTNDWYEQENNNDRPYLLAWLRQHEIANADSNSARKVIKLSPEKTASTIKALKSGIYTIKIVGELNEETLLDIADSLRENENVGIALDLSETKLKYIPDNVFHDCENLNGIKFPNTLEKDSFGATDFENCTSLTCFVVADGNTWYTSENGLILEKINLSPTDKPIETKNLYLCPWGCKKIEIPLVFDINENAFLGCEQLSQIKFSGTCEEWKVLTKDAVWFDDFPATSVQCEDGEVQLEKKSSSEPDVQEEKEAYQEQLEEIPFEQRLEFFYRWAIASDGGNVGIGTARSYKTWLRSVRNELNEEHGEHWFDRLPDGYAEIAFAVTEKVNAASTTAEKKGWNNKQSAFKKFITYLEHDYEDFPEDEEELEQDAVGTESESPAGQSEQVSSYSENAPASGDTSVIETLNNNDLISKFRSRLTSQSRWYPKFGLDGGRGLLYPIRTITRIFANTNSNGNENPWERLMKQNINNMDLLLDETGEKRCKIQDVKQIELLKNGEFTVIQKSGIKSRLYTRTADGKIRVENSFAWSKKEKKYVLKCWRQLSIDHIIPLEKDLKTKEKQLTGLRKITEIFSEYRSSFPENKKHEWRDEKSWSGSFYEAKKNLLEGLRDELFADLNALDNRYEIMDSIENSKKGKEA